MIDFLRSLSASLAGLVIGIAIYILWHFRKQKEVHSKKLLSGILGTALAAAYVSLDQWSRIGTPPTARLVLGLGSMTLLGYFLVLSVLDIKKKDS